MKKPPSKELVALMDQMIALVRRVDKLEQRLGAKVKWKIDQQSERKP